MLLFAVLMPMEEVFDQWDRPGLANDTEFAAFTIVFAICLVLLVCTLVASGILWLSSMCLGLSEDTETARSSDVGEITVWLVPPLSPGPLRI